FFKIILRQFFSAVLFMRRRDVFLLNNQHYDTYLLIEKGSDAWYYVITARETNKNNTNQKEEKSMISAGVAIAGIAAVTAAGFGMCALYLFIKG
ncbi:hypothetical protein SAMN02910317_03223, partial [Ruminococcaceae bacterium FB2012]